MSQVMHFGGVKLWARKFGCVKFWTNIMSVLTKQKDGAHILRANSYKCRYGFIRANSHKLGNILYIILLYILFI